MKRSVRLGVFLLVCPWLAVTDATGAPAAGEPPTLMVVGVGYDLPKKARKKEMEDLRLGMGIRGRLVELAAGTGHYWLLEDRALAPSLREAVGGYWLREAEAPDLVNLDGLQRRAGVDWVLWGSLTDFGVTRSRSSFGVKWRYRAVVRLCLRGASGQERCAESEGKSVDKKRAFGVVYRGDDVVWDQAGPAEAIDLALSKAFAKLVPAAAGPAVRPPRAPDEKLRVYVASFGLAAQVADTYPELAQSQTGLGICSRIVDALWESDRFTFLEEKAEVVDQMVRLMRDEVREKEAVAATEAPWLLYGEVVDLQVVRDEKITRLKTEMETRLTLQIRLVERASRRFVPATGVGIHRAPLTDWRGGAEIKDLDPRSVAFATDAAVLAAADRLTELLFP